MTKCWVPFKEVNFYVPSGIIAYCCKHVPELCEPIESYAHGKLILDNIYLQSMRKSLFSNDKIAICTECWKSEERGEKSWRQTEGTVPDDKLNSLSFDKNSYTQVALYFDNTCDSACAYCGPQLSSKWEGELKKAAPLDLPFKFPYKTVPKDVQTYETRVQRILEFLEALGAQAGLYQKKIHLTFLGGEPLLSPEIKNGSFMKYLEHFYRATDASRDFQLVLTFHTNAGTPKFLLDRFFTDLAHAKTIYKNLKVKVIFSIDTVGSAHEFIRFGSKWSTVDANIHTYCAQPIIDQIGFSPTLSVFSITTLESLFLYLANIARTYSMQINTCLGTAYFPFYLNPYELTSDFAPYIQKAQQTFAENKIFFTQESQDIIIPTLEMLYTKILQNESKSAQTVESLSTYLDYVAKVRNMKVHDYIPNFSAGADTSASPGL